MERLITFLQTIVVVHAGHCYYERYEGQSNYELYTYCLTGCCGSFSEADAKQCCPDTGAKIGIFVGIFVLVIVIVGVCIYLHRRRRRLALERASRIGPFHTTNYGPSYGSRQYSTESNSAVTPSGSGHDQYRDTDSQRGNLDNVQRSTGQRAKGSYQRIDSSN